MILLEYGRMWFRDRRTLQAENPLIQIMAVRSSFAILYRIQTFFLLIPIKAYIHS
jgi:hypothetical protein